MFVNLDAHRTTILVQKVLQAEIFGSKSIQIGPAPNGNENLVSANLLGLAFRVFIDNRIALDSGDFAAQVISSSRGPKIFGSISTTVTFVPIVL